MGRKTEFAPVHAQVTISKAALEEQGLRIRDEEYFITIENNPESCMFQDECGDRMVRELCSYYSLDDYASDRLSNFIAVELVKSAINNAIVVD